MELTNRKGVGLMAIGALMMTIALFLGVHYVMDEWRSGGYASSALQVLEQVEQTGETIPSEMGLPAYEANGRVYVGTLTIPALDMVLPIMDSYTPYNRKVGPSIYWGSPEESFMVIAGYGFQGHFAPLKKLTAGDEVLYAGVGGEPLRYTVAKVEILKPSEVEEMLSGTYPLTLFTSTTGGNSRLAVRCEAA